MAPIRGIQLSYCEKWLFVPAVPGKPESSHPLQPTPETANRAMAALLRMIEHVRVKQELVIEVRICGWLLDVDTPGVFLLRQIRGIKKFLVTVDDSGNRYRGFEIHRRTGPTFLSELRRECNSDILQKDQVTYWGRHSSTARPPQSPIARWAWEEQCWKAQMRRLMVTFDE